MEKVYEFAYSDCIHESSHSCVSLHRTKEGAEKALEKHRANCKKEWEEVYKDLPEPFEFGKHESWIIRERNIYD